MKRCPSCNRTYTDISLNFCLEDGTPLVIDVVPAYDPHATVRDQTPRHTAEPPATEIYRPRPLLNQVPEMLPPRTAQPQWAPAPQPLPLPLPPPKKSNAVWWVIGGIAVVGILGVGLIVMLLVLARIGAEENANTGTVNSNRTTNTNRTTNANSNTSSFPASFTDNFSEEKWKTGNFQYGDIWYKDDEYHMRSKDQTYLFMYAPSSEYATENATVRITTR
ncbi:MAG: hypothetical protein ND895_11095, partial [Pyrinomonadaceae bacterium]|nr:hypothetical protein [Pyrinomonadaceae bacterium]